MTNFLWVDIGVVAIFIISILVGIFRGFVREVLSVLSWVAAAVVAYMYGERAVGLIQPYLSSPELSLALAYVLVFLVALLVFSIVSYLLGRIFSASGLTGIDRSLGSVFGVLRAAAIVALLILAGRFMSFDEHEWWAGSQFLDHFQPLAEWIHAQLPEAWQQALSKAPKT